MKKLKIIFILFYFCFYATSCKKSTSNKKTSFASKKINHKIKNKFIIKKDYEIKKTYTGKLQPSKLNIKMYEIIGSIIGYCSSFKRTEYYPKNTLKKTDIVKEWNILVKPMGYEFKKRNFGRGKNLYKNNKLILSTTDGPYQILVNSKKTRLVFVASINNKYIIFDNEIIKRWDYNLHGYMSPYLYYDKIILVEKISKIVNKDGLCKFAVKLNNKIIYGFNSIDLAMPPIANFFVKNNHWILEFNDKIVIDGVLLNKKFAYRKIFNYFYLNEKPFFFFVDNSNKVKINYDGKVQNIYFNDVPHYGCCDNGFFNPINNPNLIDFYDSQKNKWVYVVIKN